VTSLSPAEPPMLPLNNMTVTSQVFAKATRLIKVSILTAPEFLRLDCELVQLR
jgi:hypothetical protein